MKKQKTISNEKELENLAEKFEDMSDDVKLGLLVLSKEMREKYKFSGGACLRLVQINAQSMADEFFLLERVALS